MNIEKQKNFIIKFGFWITIIVLIFYGLKFALPFFLPFVLAFLIATTLNRPINFLAAKLHRKRTLPAVVLTILFFLAAGALFLFLGFWLLGVLKEIVMTLPQLYTDSLEPMLLDVFAGLKRQLAALEPAAVVLIEDASDSILTSLGNFVSDFSLDMIGSLSGFAATVPGTFLKLVITIIVTFFITIDYPAITGFIIRQLPKKAQQVLSEAKNYAGGTLLRCAASYILILSITFAELAIGLSLLKIPNALLIALIISIFDILPVLGTGGIMIPWAIISFICGDIFIGIGMAVLYLIITVIRNIIEPKIVGHQVGLHPVVTLGCMLSGLQLFGLLGLFGFPITLSLIKNLNDKGVIHIFK